MVTQPRSSSMSVASIHDAPHLPNHVASSMLRAASWFIPLLRATASVRRIPQGWVYTMCCSCATSALLRFHHSAGALTNARVTCVHAFCRETHCLQKTQGHLRVRSKRMHRQQDPSTQDAPILALDLTLRGARSCALDQIIRENRKRPLESGPRLLHPTLTPVQYPLSPQAPHQACRIDHSHPHPPPRRPTLLHLVSTSA